MYDFDYIDEPMLFCTKYAASVNCNENRKLGIRILENVLIQLDNEGSLVILDKNNQNNQSSFYENSNHEKKPVIYLGNWCNVWGHLLTDSLSKLWILFSDLYVEMSLFDYDFVYCAGNCPLPKQFEEILGLLGLEKSKLRRIDKTTCFDKIYLPDDSIFVKKDNIIEKRDIDKKGGLFYFCDEYKKLIDKIKESAEPNHKYEKICFSLGNPSKIFGNHLLENLLSQCGYKVLNPIDMTFKEQLTLLMGCKAFCTIEGSISFNALFLKSGTDVMLIRKLAYIDPYQFMINQISDLRVTYIDSHLSILCDKNYPYIGPFFLYPNENFVRYINKLGNKSEVEFSFLRFLSYMIFALKSQSDRKQYIKTVSWETDMYYFEVLRQYIKKNFLVRCLIRILPK